MSRFESLSRALLAFVFLALSALSALSAGDALAQTKVHWFG